MIDEVQHRIGSIAWVVCKRCGVQHTSSEFASKFYTSLREHRSSPEVTVKTFSNS